MAMAAAMESVGEEGTGSHEIHEGHEKVEEPGQCPALRSVRKISSAAGNRLIKTDDVKVCGSQCGRSGFLVMKTTAVAFHQGRMCRAIQNKFKKKSYRTLTFVTRG